MKANARSELVGWLAAAALSVWVVAPLAITPGVPLFSHDWIWSPFASRSTWATHFLYSAWVETGLGDSNSAISVNPLAWMKPVLASLLSGRASLLAYLYLSLWFAFAGVFRLAYKNLSLPAGWALASACFFAATPFVFSKIASGQSSYWAAMAAFIWGVAFCLDAFERGHVRDAARSAVCFALASIQLQFLFFAVVTYALAAIVYRTRRGVAFAAAGCAAASVLALPAAYFLALRGPELGAFISPPYDYWIASQSAPGANAVTMLGYSVRYVERALGDGTAALDAVQIAGFAMLLLAVAAVALQRNRRTALLGAIAAFGIVFVAGVYGPAARLWVFAFRHSAEASFLRELYHGEILYALPAALLAAMALAWGARRFPAPAAGVAVALSACLGLATETGGLARVLPFSVQPQYRERLVAALPPGESRVLFLPAQQPLATRGDTVGGNDGLDWVDPTRHSMYEYYLPPLVAYVEAALYRGDAASAARILPRLACSGVIYRTAITSLGYGRALGGADRTLETLTSAIGAPIEISPGVDLFVVRDRPLFDLAQRLEPMPADLASMANPNVSYLDVPGRDPAGYASGLFLRKPDPDQGWIRRRDAAVADASDLAAPSYGIVTNKAGATVTLDGVPSGNALFWAPAGANFGYENARSMRPARLTLPTSNVSIVSQGPAAILEIGERPIERPVSQLSGSVTIDRWSHAWPWEYEATLHLTGRSAVVLRERYDDGWQLSAPGLRVQAHARADGFANAWIVSGSGVYDVRAFYAAQTPTFVLLALSSGLFVTILVLAMRPVPT